LNFEARGVKTHPSKEKSIRSIENNGAIDNDFFIFIESLILLGFGPYNTAKIYENQVIT
jgi:hypothetical protein